VTGASQLAGVCRPRLPRAATVTAGPGRLAAVRTVPLIIEPDPDEPDFATVLVDATIAGWEHRLVLRLPRQALGTDGLTAHSLWRAAA